MLGVNTCNSETLCRDLRYKTAQVSWPGCEPQVRPGVCTFRKLPSPVNTPRYVPASLGWRSLDVLLFFSFFFFMNKKPECNIVCVQRKRKSHKTDIQKCQTLWGGQKVCRHESKGEKHSFKLQMEGHLQLHYFLILTLHTTHSLTEVTAPTSNRNSSIILLLIITVFLRISHICLSVRKGFFHTDG